MDKLPRSFYLRENVQQISRELLGKVLATRTPEGITRGMITETEAYQGPEDKASHAYGNRKTERTRIMYEEGGVAYIYLCYGIHELFNVITNREGIPHAVLIRAVEPLGNTDIMLKRRGKDRVSNQLTSGPGCLTQALGINRGHNGNSLQGDEVWIEEYKEIPKDEITEAPRVGIDYAEEFVELPWRYYITGSKWVSRKN